MGANTAIEWTEATWNPVTGCTRTSPGCAHCYAERMARRLQAMGQANYRNGFAVATHRLMLDLPLRWRSPRTIFVNSMSDLFHEGVEVGFVHEVFDTMRRAHWHRFQVLTKRSRRLRELAPSLPRLENVWIGVTVENADYLDRLDDLRVVPAALRFVSLEPLLGPIQSLSLTGVDWVIVGGESGPGARPVQEKWVLEIRDQCRSAGVPFFFKQWGGTNKKKAGRLLAGRTWDEIPQPRMYG